MIKFQNVSKTYPNGVQALKNVNLTIEPGQFVAIIGLGTQSPRAMGICRCHTAKKNF